MLPQETTQDIAIPRGADRPSEEHTEQEQAKRRCIEKPEISRARAMLLKSPSMRAGTCLVMNGEFHTPASVKHQCIVLAS